MGDRNQNNFTFGPLLEPPCIKMEGKFPKLAEKLNEKGGNEGWIGNLTPEKALKSEPTAAFFAATKSIWNVTSNFQR